MVHVRACFIVSQLLKDYEKMVKKTGVKWRLSG
jgi:hypothetical protein